MQPQIRNLPEMTPPQAYWRGTITALVVALPAGIMNQALVSGGDIEAGSPWAILFWVLIMFGAGVVAARAHGADEIVDPRPWAIGTIDETFRKYDVGPVLPAMGYSDGQLAEMEKIIDSAEADVVVIGTPIDLRRVIEIRKPAVRVRYDLEVLPDSPSLLDVLKPVLG